MIPYINKLTEEGQVLRVGINYGYNSSSRFLLILLLPLRYRIRKYYDFDTDITHYAIPCRKWVKLRFRWRAPHIRGKRFVFSAISVWKRVGKEEE